MNEASYGKGVQEEVVVKVFVVAQEEVEAHDSVLEYLAPPHPADSRFALLFLRAPALRPRVPADWAEGDVAIIAVPHRCRDLPHLVVQEVGGANCRTLARRVLRRLPDDGVLGSRQEQELRSLLHLCQKLGALLDVEEGAVWSGRADLKEGGLVVLPGICEDEEGTLTDFSDVLNS